MTDTKSQEMTLFQKIELAQLLSLFPALTLMVFIRRKIGFRMVKPTWLISMAAIIWAVSYVPVSGPGVVPTTSDATEMSTAIALRIFAVVMLAFGIYQRWRRWSDLNTGQVWHTYSGGISHFEKLPLPGFLREHNRIYRFLDPALGWLVGLILLPVIPSVGLWVAFSASCLLVHEQTRYEKQLDHTLDVLDSLTDSEVQGELVQHYSDAKDGKAAASRQREDTAGIPTGVAADIERQIARRRARRANVGPAGIAA